MKNLKKVLSLVLALAMALSLMTAAFAKTSGDFTDVAATNDYKEAIDVMTAAGVFNGMTETTFSPDGSLTREQAAKIITYMLMGQADGDKLTTTIAPYSDVPATRWSAGAIAYCTNENILAGVGNGKFNPEGKLTGLEFGKMLLCALGYDASIEEYTGSKWAINVAKGVLNADLDTNLDDVALSAVLTRAQAAQMALNTFKADLVEYSSKGQTITVNGAVISTGATDAVAVTSSKDSNNIKDETPTIAVSSTNPDTVQFAEKYADGLKLNSTAVTDDLGRPSHKWTYKEKSSTTTIGTYADDAAVTFIKTVSNDDMKTNLKSYEFKPTVDVVTNETAQTTSTITSAYETGIAALTGNGLSVEVYADDDDVIYKVVVLKPVYGEVTTVSNTSANKTHGAYTTYTVKGEGTVFTGTANGRVYTSIVNEKTDVDTAILNGTFAKKDKVTFYKGAENLYIDPVTEASGVLTSITNKGVMTIDGETYDLSAVDGFVKPGVKKASQDFYVDVLGNVIKSYTDDTINYVYVIEYKKGSVDNGDGTYDDVDKARVIYPDGTTAIVTTSANWTAYKGTVVSYTTNGKDQLVYKAPVAGSTSGVTAIADDSTTVGGLRANNNTLYAVAKYVDDDDDATTPKVFDSIVTYTGYKNVPVYTTLTNSWAVDTDTTLDGIANVVFIGDPAASATETGKWTYVTGTYNQTTAGYEYDTIVKGASDTVTKAGTTLTADTLYTSIGATDTVAASAGTNAENKGGLLYINGANSGKTVEDDVVVYFINMSDDSVSTGNVSDDLSSKYDADPNAKGGTRGVYLEMKTGSTTEVTTIYILYNSED